MTNKSNNISSLPDSVSGNREKQENTKIAKRKRGRPPGAKNKKTLFKELMNDEFQNIAQKNIKKTFEVLFEEAHAGNMSAIKMVMDRVVPASKAVDLDNIGNKGLTVSINIGSLEESPLVTGEILEGEVIDGAIDDA